MYRPLTEQEILTSGLLGHSRSPKLEVVNFGQNKGRGVVASEPISKGAYVCEYRTYRVYPVGSAEEAKLAEEYEINGEGSFVLQTAYSIPQFGVRLCFDATRRYNDIGRLINHSPDVYNLKPGQPLYVRGKCRVGMLAVRDIFVGQEITYDYGVRSEMWMKRRSRGSTDESGQERRTVNSSSEGQGMRYLVMRGAGESSGAGQEVRGESTEESCSAGQETAKTENSSRRKELKTETAMWRTPEDETVPGMRGAVAGGAGAGRTLVRVKQKRKELNTETVMWRISENETVQGISAGAGRTLVRVEQKRKEPHTEMETGRTSEDETVQEVRGAGAGGASAGRTLVRVEQKRKEPNTGTEMWRTSEDETVQGMRGAGAGGAGQGMRGAGAGRTLARVKQKRKESTTETDMWRTSEDETVEGCMCRCRCRAGYEGCRCRCRWYRAGDEWCQL